MVEANSGAASNNMTTNANALLSDNCLADTRGLFLRDVVLKRHLQLFQEIDHSLMNTRTHLLGLFPKAFSSFFKKSITPSCTVSEAEITKTSLITEALQIPPESVH